MTDKPIAEMTACENLDELDKILAKANAPDDGVPCPWCAIQGVRVVPTVRRAWLMPPQVVCPRCAPNWQRPALWRRVVRALADKFQRI